MGCSQACICELSQNYYKGEVLLSIILELFSGAVNMNAGMMMFYSISGISLCHFTLFMHSLTQLISTLCVCELSLSLHPVYFVLVNSRYMYLYCEQKDLLEKQTSIVLLSL